MIPMAMFNSYVTHYRVGTMKFHYIPWNPMKTLHESNEFQLCSAIMFSALGRWDDVGRLGWSVFHNGHMAVAVDMKHSRVYWYNG